MVPYNCGVVEGGFGVPRRLGAGGRRLKVEGEQLSLRQEEEVKKVGYTNINSRGKFQVTTNYLKKMYVVWNESRHTIICSEIWWSDSKFSFKNSCTILYTHPIMSSLKYKKKETLFFSKQSQEKVSFTDFFLWEKEDRSQHVLLQISMPNFISHKSFFLRKKYVT